MTWEVMDATKMDGFRDESFDLVIDKATLDSILEFQKKGLLLTTATYLKEVQRILRPGGWYLCISFDRQTQKLLELPHLDFECQHIQMTSKSENVRPHHAYL